MNLYRLTARDLDGYLTRQDRANIRDLETFFRELPRLFRGLSIQSDSDQSAAEDAAGSSEEDVVAVYGKLERRMRELVAAEPRLDAFCWQAPALLRSEISHVVSRLRHRETGSAEFLYRMRRAYELLFTLAYVDGGMSREAWSLVPTPVDVPAPNFAAHLTPRLTAPAEGSAVCVMLRAALLPSLVLAKEIEEHSPGGAGLPFALFKVYRDEGGTEDDMEYVLDLDRSHFDAEELDGRELIFADPMNATGGSLVTVMRYLESRGIRPASVRFFNVISAVTGCLRILRALPQTSIHSLWLDPVLNELAYILPGLGDAGDRMHGRDEEGAPRDVLALIETYGSKVASIYASQIQRIEQTITRCSV